MEKRLCQVALFIATVLCGATAAAQTPAAPAPSAKTNSAPVVTFWYGGAATGVAAVQNVGATFNGEVGLRAWRNLDVSVEAGWFQDTVSRRRSGVANTLTAFLTQSQGLPSTSTVNAPATYVSANARWVFENSHMYRPYVIVGVGGARVTLKTHITLGGADVTNTLAQYGVTLGEDLSGQSSHPAITGGLGVMIPLHEWFVDAGYRLTAIRTPGQSANVSRLNVGVFFRF